MASKGKLQKEVEIKLTSKYNRNGLATALLRYGICVLIAHHTRKRSADDKFDMISGTTALLGAADGGFILQKEKRTSNN